MSHDLDTANLSHKWNFDNETNQHARNNLFTFLASKIDKMINQEHTNSDPSKHAQNNQTLLSFVHHENHITHSPPRKHNNQIQTSVVIQVITVNLDPCFNLPTLLWIVWDGLGLFGFFGCFVDSSWRITYLHIFRLAQPFEMKNNNSGRKMMLIKKEKQKKNKK